MASILNSYSRIERIGSSLTKKNIPFYLPSIDSSEVRAVTSVLRQGLIGGNGSVSWQVEAVIKNKTKAKYAFFVNSCTSALELAMMACGIDAASEVICPSFSFVSVANAILRQGARPVFVEIDRETLNMDVSAFRKAITRKTKAVVPIHYAGLPCYMDEIMNIAKKHNLMVIEDAAQAMGSFYKGRHLGTIGDIGCISFHSTKNLTCGEGGVFLTNNKDLAEKVELMREKGTNRAKFFRGEIDKYTWVSIGSSYVQSDMLAAILLAQLKKLPYILERHYEITEYYNECLKPYKDIVTLPKEIDGSKANWHIYAILLRPDARDGVIKTLKKQGVSATFHFVPLHTSPFGKQLGYKKGDLPVTEHVSESLMRLPIYSRMTQSDVRRVVSVLKKALDTLI